MAGDIHGVTNLSSLSLAGDLNSGAVSLTSLGKLTMGSGTSVHFVSGSTLAIGAAHVSQRTTAVASLASIAPTDLNNGVWGFTFLASGMSLCYRSGNTIYVFNSAGSMAAP